MDVMEARAAADRNLAMACPVCSTGRLRPFASLGTAPVHVGALWPSAAEARGCPRGELLLGHCADCGFVHNLTFDPARADYAVAYDNALHFSAVFRHYERRLAEGLIARHGLHGADILEIGCGSGHFLGLICELGDSRGLGFDPSHDPDHADPLLTGRARVVREYFGEHHAQHPADLICARHVLEHVPRPDHFMRAIRRGIGARETAVYIEVPNGLLALERLSVGDVIYEHCSYFVESSLRALMAATGFEVTDLREAYDGQFLAVEARPGAERRIAVEPTAAAACAAFAAGLARRLDEWRRRIGALSADGRPIVAWGAGAKAVGLLNLLGDDAPVERVVDMNPRKQGTHLAGGGQRIVAPAALVADPPGAVLVMNPLYADEITATVRDLGLDAQIVTVA